MKHRLEELLKYDIKEIVGSPLVLELLDVYSKLFLNGSQPSYCEKCLTKYYYQLKQYGMEQQERIQKIKDRTCIPAWNGLKYIPAVARHFNSDLITDEEATDCLIDGKLRESHFKKLPDIYLELKKEPEKKDQEKEKQPEPKLEKKKVVKKAAKK